MLSACPLHWRTEDERDFTSITVLAELIDETDLRCSPAAYNFIVRPKTEPSSPDDRTRRPHSVPDARLEFRGCNTPADMPPTHSGYKSYSVFSAPCQAGVTLIAFNGEEDGEGDPPPSRMLATFTVDGKVHFKSIDAILPRDFLPATRSLYVDHYSGAVYFYSAESRSIVILYFD